MKKSLIMAVIATMLLTALTGCGKNTENTKDAAKAEYLKDFNVDEFVTLGEYKGIEATVSSTEATQEQIDAWIRQDLSDLISMEAVEDRDTVVSGDIANIDYVGKKEGTAFEGGTDSGYDLEIGSGTFIPGFEDGIIGMKKGETRDIPLTFPENYGNDLAGCDVIFTVTVNEIKEYKMPEITDELAASLGRDGISTAQDYQTYAEDTVQAQLEESNEMLILNQILEKLEDISTIQDPPESMVERMYEASLDKCTSQASMYGVDVSYFVSVFYGGSAEEYEQTLCEIAEGTAKQYMMLASVAEKEGITASSEEVFEDVREQLGDASDEEVEAAMEGLDQEAYREYLLINKVCSFLREQASVTAENA